MKWVFVKKRMENNSPHYIDRLGIEKNGNLFPEATVVKNTKGRIMALVK